MARRSIASIVILSVAACGDSQANGNDQTPDAATDAPLDGPVGCALAEATSPLSTYEGCALLSRDTSGCQASRAAAGLGGFWLSFSCRVVLSVSGGVVSVNADSRPDYASEYFPKSDAFYAAEPGATPNPNAIAARSITIQVPLAPASSASQTMMGGAVGVAVNGVAIFDDQAAPGEDIYKELATFDACAGHPQMTGMYHYHTEPYAISHDDSAFIGIMRDGYPIYGRRDHDGSIPALDAAGGHTGTTPDSATPVYHYHLNKQTSSNPMTAGKSGYFITTGVYHAAPGACTGCQ